jgi:hypothetical protein
MSMMLAFYMMQSLVYFLLATAFLVIYLVTMYSFITGRKTTIEVFENGIRIGKTSAMWPEIAGIDDNGIVEIARGSKIEVPRSIYERDVLITLIRRNLR